MGFKNVFQTITLPVIRKGAVHVTVILLKIEMVIQLNIINWLIICCLKNEARRDESKTGNNKMHVSSTVTETI